MRSQQEKQGLINGVLPLLPSNEIPMYLSLSEACGPQDDWTGVQEKARRRKIQNRLNVRAHRKRKAQEAGNLLENVLASRRRNPRIRASSEVGAIAINSTAPNQIDGISTHQQQMRKAIAEHLLSNGGLEDLKARFPLSSDHLIPLIQYNTLRAILTNIHILHVCDLVLRPFPSTTCVPEETNAAARPVLSDMNKSGKMTPDTLQPTLLQRTIPHSAWIETLPLAKMRDNVVVAEALIDLREFQADCLGIMCCHGIDSSGENGVIAWSDPWHPRGWELTEGFIKKWKRQLLQGCDEIIEATNYWRGLRDEEPLEWENL